MDKATSPSYRLYVNDADLDIVNLSNRAGNAHPQSASARLRGRFMGSGHATVTAAFTPDAPTDHLGAELAIEGGSLPALNDLLRAYQNLDVAAGSFALYSQVTVKNGYLQGYVKPLLRDVKMGDDSQEEKKPLGTRIKEKALTVIAHVLKNHQTGEVATRTEISGKLGDTKPHLSEIIAGLLHNAFGKPLTHGLENPGQGKTGAGK